MANRKKAPEVVVLTTLQSDGQEKLRQHVEAIEGLRNEKAEIDGLISERFKLCKSDGFDTTALKEVLAKRKKTAIQRSLHDDLVDLYMHALGMTPIEAEIERRKEADALDRSEQGKTEDERKLAMAGGKPSPVVDSARVDELAEKLADMGAIESVSAPPATVEVGPKPSRGRARQTAQEAGEGAFKDSATIAREAKEAADRKLEAAATATQHTRRRPSIFGQAAGSA